MGEKIFQQPAGVKSGPETVLITCSAHSVTLQRIRLSL